MFHRVSLDESFKFVATPEEWERFLSFGPVTDLDLWIGSLAAYPGQPDPPGKLEEWDRLRSAFLARVIDRLTAGDWKAEGFIPDHPPEIRLIPQVLWRSLELNHFDNEANGPGFRFVHLLVSAAQPQPDSVAPGTKKRRLTEWLRQISSDDRTPILTEELLAEARSALNDKSLTLHMLKNCLRSEDFGARLLVKGRPRK